MHPASVSPDMKDLKSENDYPLSPQMALLFQHFRWLSKRVDLATGFYCCEILLNEISHYSLIYISKLMSVVKHVFTCLRIQNMFGKQAKTRGGSYKELYIENIIVKY